jgi:cytochrome c553
MRARGATAALLCAIAGYLFASPALAQQAALVGDPARGKEISYTCLGCHGVEGYKNAYPMYSVPKLEGQHPEYLVAALQGYKGGDRAHLTMHSQASELSEQDIADVAAFFAGKPLVPTGRSGLAVPQAAQLCTACHGADGVAVAPMYPSLAGQHEDYLVRALNEYRKGGRKNPVMVGFAKNLKDIDVAMIAAYYARQTPGLRTEPRPQTVLGEPARTPPH